MRGILKLSQLILVLGLTECAHGSASSASAKGASADHKGGNAATDPDDETMAAEIAKQSSGETPAEPAESHQEDTKQGGNSGSDAGPKTDQNRKEEIWRLIKNRRESVLSCYHDAKKKDPSIGTKLTVSFTLNPDGTFKEPPSVSKERSDITDEQVTNCALATIKSMKFPPHPKGMQTTFHYPFGF